MKPIPLLILLSLIAIAPGGCGTTPYREPASATNYTGKLHARLDDAGIRQKLMAQHHDWHGTPYRYGGLSKHGVDCSGFVYLTFRSRFGIRVPRSTEQQSETGVHISQTQLHPGDLVFFRTGFSKTHVGIYLEKGKFLHASTSKGVMISHMDNVYWRDRFWKAQRI